MEGPIYLDYNSTTPTDPAVVEAMIPFFYRHPGNAASRSHAFGWVAEEAVDNARTQLADLIAVEPDELIFTSGATESDNLALRGIFDLYHRKGRHIVTVKTEHKAVLDTCQDIEKKGGEVTYLNVEPSGLINLDELRKAIRPDTILVSIMWVNNETGVIQPMKEIGKICEEKGVLLMSDATQALGKIPVHPKETGVHLMAFTAHKMYGPKGIGALYVSRKKPRVKLAPLIFGGGHEKGMRSGTLNVPGIVGFGKAAAIAAEHMREEAQRIGRLRDQLETGVTEQLEAVYINGHQQQRLYNVSNLSFLHLEAESLMKSFRQQLAAASGSACSSADLEPSHVLMAMGLEESLAQGSIRFSLGRFSTAEDIQQAIPAIVQSVKKARADSPVWTMYKEGLLE